MSLAMRDRRHPPPGSRPDAVEIDEPQGLIAIDDDVPGLQVAMRKARVVKPPDQLSRSHATTAVRTDR